MLCSECNQRPATLHYSKIINGTKTEFHLCEQCAAEKGELFMLNGSSGFSFNSLLANLLNIEPSFQQIKQNPYKKEDVLQCKECSMTFSQFLEVGRFGCPSCYETFKEQLQPVLKRLHGGNIEHKGKVPERIGGHILIKKDIGKLKEDLKELINKEEFEKAAEVRDEIRRKEKQLLAFHEGGE
ncbi:UvrB/UvrC motif-containing protein [Niallia nealsonii]|uniref:UVR domain-containing protein n=1 Tax=Niallia nealsonii TaxID=115979 RepID=A0A2N0Z4V7_9BACI|nr:UvrB/UvrC motif-containing protein [Niallia nealsonii]PKG24519.1 hypothetical protein CWS01_05960 [Niallia nealsonii]